MSAKSIALTAVLLLCASLARATIVEVPLPGLLGGYQNTLRSSAIVLPGLPSVIHGAWFRVSGTTVVGQLDCTSDGGGISPLPMDLYASMVAEGPANFWFASDHTQGQTTGDFSWTAPFWSTPPGTTWSFLMDGVAEITLVGGEPGIWCLLLASPSAVITEAVFIIDAEFPVAAQPSTWGSIKALYR